MNMMMWRMMKMRMRMGCIMNMKMVIIGGGLSG